MSCTVLSDVGNSGHLLSSACLRRRNPTSDVGAGFKSVRLACFLQFRVSNHLNINNKMILGKNRMFIPGNNQHKNNTVHGPQTGMAPIRDSGPPV